MRWQKEKDPLAPRGERPLTGVHLLPLLGLLAFSLSLGAYALFEEEEGTGEVSRAVSRFEDFFEEHDAIAVFLGWEGTHE